MLEVMPEYAGCNRAFCWTIAGPSKEYLAMGPEEIIEKYKHMAFEEFDEQFETKTKKVLGKTERVENIFEKPVLFRPTPLGAAEMKRTLIKLEMKRWYGTEKKGRRVDATLFAAVYQWPDDSPYGEANCVQVRRGRSKTSVNNIRTDLMKFYERQLWNVVPKCWEGNPEKLEAYGLEDSLFPIIHSVYNKPFLPVSKV